MHVCAKSDADLYNDDYEEIRQLECEWGNAYLNKNLDILDQIMSDDYVFTDPAGRIIGKAESLTHVKAAQIVFESTNSNNVEIRIYKDTAIVTARSVFRGRYKGLNISGQYQYTDVFIRQQERWRAVASQATLVGGGVVGFMFNRMVAFCIGACNNIGCKLQNVVNTLIT